MPEPSPAVFGSSIVNARSFAFAFNGSAGAAVNKAIALGGYRLRADHDAVVKLAPTTGLADVVVLPSTQADADHATSTVLVPANTDFALDVPGDGYSLSVLGATSTGGTLSVSGPLAYGTMR